MISNARWALNDLKLEESCFSFSRIGFALRETGHHAEAVEQYKTGINLDAEDGPTRAGLALTYGMMKDYEKAIEEMEAAEALFERNLAEGRSSGNAAWTLETLFLEDLESLGRFYENANKHDDALRTYETAIKVMETADFDRIAWDTNSSIFVVALSVMNDAEKYQDMVNLIERILKHPMAGREQFKEVYKWLMQLDSVFLPSIYKTRRWDVNDRLYLSAWKSIRRYGTEFEACLVRNSRATSIMNLHPDHQEQAIRLLRDVLDVNDESAEMSGLKDSAKMTLARAYIDRTLQARETDQWEVVGVNAQKLMELERSGADPGEHDDIGWTDFNLVIAAWHQINGRMKKAKRSARGVLKHGLDWLSDDDPSNDLGAWVQLADSLLAVGDETRAIAANGMIRQPADDDKTRAESSATAQPDGDAMVDPSAADNSKVERTSGSEEAVAGASDPSSLANGAPSPQQSHNLANGDEKDPAHTTDDTTRVTPDSGEHAAKDQANASVPETASPEQDDSFYYSCDGPCMLPIKSQDEMWRCSYCITDFCTACHEAVFNATMDGWSVCGRLHKHFRMPGIAEKFPVDHIRVGDQDVLISQWLKDLRADWGIP